MNEIAEESIDLFPDIIDDVTKYLETLKTQWAVKSNRASMLDDICSRRLVYYRTEYDKAKPVSDYLQGIFKTGTELEDLTRTVVLNKAGLGANPRWRLSGSQTSIQDNTFKQYQITGHIDGILQVEIETDRWENFGPADIKHLSRFTFQAINRHEDLQKFSYSRKWNGQIQLYAFGMNYSYGTLILVSKENLFNIKVIRVPVDMEYVENLLQKAKAINEHVEAGTMPDQINNAKECMNCPFAHICLPDLESTGNLKIIEDDEIEELLKTRDEFAEYAKLYKKADDELKSKLVEGQDIMIGDYLVQWKFIEGERKPTKGGKFSYYRKTISRQGENEEG
jgi:hypothetical protein